MGEALAPAPAPPARGWVYAHIAFWVSLSAFCVMLNKHILFYLGFKFPATLAVMHMASAFAVAAGVIHGTPGGRQHLPPQDKMRGPFLVSLGAIAALFGFVLVLSNSAFMYLSVPTIQMLKACGSTTTFLVGLAFGNEVYSHRSMVKVLIVGGGVIIASYGDIKANLFGVAIQMSSIVCDAVRCNLLQKTMQRSAVKLSPVGTLYYVAPMAAAVLAVPAYAWEWHRLGSHDRPIPYPWLLGSCVAAATLNLTIFSLIGKTSALTTSITGPLKEWVCIVASMALHGTAVSTQQWCGYAVAMCGIFWYQRDKFFGGREMPPLITANSGGGAGGAAALDEEKLPLVQPPAAPAGKAG